MNAQDRFELFSDVLSKIRFEPLNRAQQHAQLERIEAAARLGGGDRDAQRYRWLRSQHWHDNTIAAVYRPKDAMKLGHDAPAGERLDELIDQALGAAANAAGKRLAEGKSV